VRVLFLTILTFIGLSIHYSQPSSNKQREILILQDQRSLGEGKLYTFLKDKDAEIRYRAAVALANIQDSSSIDALAESLTDQNSKVRTASAFALGQIGGSRSANILLKIFNNEKQSIVLGRILEALGKSGDLKSLDSAFSLSEKRGKIISEKDMLLCIVRFAIRQIKNERSILECFKLIDSKNPEIRSSALYALWRSAPNELIDLEILRQKDKLIKLTVDKNADVRMQLAAVLSKSNVNNIDEILDGLEATEKRENDWHVWVQIIRARSGQAIRNKEVLKRMPEYLKMNNNHLKITTLQAINGLSTELIRQSEMYDILKSDILKIAEDTIRIIESVRGNAFLVLGKHYPGELSRFKGLLENAQISSRIKAKLLEGISLKSNYQNYAILQANLNNESTSVSMAAWDFIRPMLYPAVINSFNLDSVGKSNLPNVIFKEAKISISKKDMGISTLVASMFSDSMSFLMFRNSELADKIVDELIEAYREMKSPDDYEARQSFVQALGSIKNVRAVPFLEEAMMKSEQGIAADAKSALHNITKREYSEQKNKSAIQHYSEDDWNVFDRIKQKSKVKIITKHGEIIVELFKEYAPFTVLNFVKLVKNKFYDGLIFHRVVPDFVVQGGDPRGDGWGGPGYNMRTEISLVNYERGSCGIASAGKDTEGCQFFITHISTPHLDGRYTIFAKVVKGMDIVDRIQVGDQIQAIQLIE
jgi:cyclophilin family peptidyl-prolyl cis-trans isomerase/HEAT repeat protein